MKKSILLVVVLFSFVALHGCGSRAANAQDEASSENITAPYTVVNIANKTIEATATAYYAVGIYFSVGYGSTEVTYHRIGSPGLASISDRVDLYQDIGDRSTISIPLYPTYDVVLIRSYKIVNGNKVFSPTSAINYKI